MNRKKILIVDDDKDLLRAMNIRLKANNYDTVFAVDGYSAIKIANEESPDLVLLDIGLPAGDGFTVIERLKRSIHHAHIPIFVLSARDPKTNKDRALEAGADKFFQKPVDNAELLDAIKEALGESNKNEKGRVQII